MYLMCAFLHFGRCIDCQRVEIYYEDVWRNDNVTCKKNSFGFVCIDNGVLFDGGHIDIVQKI